jgi:L-methionine (R)-S-oxide reductase
LIIENKGKLFKSLIKQTDTILTSKKDRETKLKAICKLLRENVSYYNVVGFYLADREHTKLLLVPFKGHPTEHVRMAFGVGTCGKAAKQKKRFVIQDITKETNYLSCSKKLELKFFSNLL